ncbi:MAG: hypothetical protein VKJ24_20455 [Synechococcales bacterium]|nr:hypothetical protein [Synechococcales bacterium]
MSQQVRSLVLSVLASSALISYQSFQASIAYAGGFEPIEQPPSPHQAVQGQASQEPPAFNLNWQKWSQPDRQGDRICREWQGNVVCLTPQVAQQMGWLRR